jgi:hypothetical protein
MDDVPRRFGRLRRQDTVIDSSILGIFVWRKGEGQGIFIHLYRLLLPDLLNGDHDHMVCRFFFFTNYEVLRHIPAVPVQQHQII